MTPDARLTVTCLEDRTVPAVFGNTWVDTHLTVSFVPDGTDVAGTASSLFRLLNSRATTAEWQGAVTSAFRTWTAATNLSATVVSDDGRALGSPGPVQGSPFVGDIRISARPLSDNVLAISNPFDLISPWAGEIIVNSNKTFDTDRSAGAYDLQTVVLHEIGHVLGLAGSTDPGSVMYESYAGARTVLSAGDVAAIQGLYGAPTAAGPSTAAGGISGADGTVFTTGDWANGAGTNDTAATATNLGQSRDSTDRRWDFAGTAALDSAADVDVYQVRTREKAGGVMVVDVSTPSGGAEPCVAVYDKKGTPVPFEVLQKNGDVTIIQLSDVKKNQTYFVAVRAADPTKWTKSETYQLGIDFRDTAVTATSFASATLTAAAPQLARPLAVTQTQAFEFRLGVESAVDSVQSGARLVVLDATGHAVFTLVARTGRVTTGEVFLQPGAYTVVVAGATADGSPLKALTIDAALLGLTDPIGPALAPDYGTIVPGPAPNGAATTTTTTTATATGFVWLAPVTIGIGFLAPTNFFSSPWW